MKRNFFTLIEVVTHLTQSEYDSQFWARRIDLF